MARVFIIGTSGYSFEDWVGTFYPPGTTRKEMFAHYIRHFHTAELNFTYYRMPSARTLAALADKSPAGFDFWVKANQATSHQHQRDAAAPFLDALTPLIDAGKLAGVLLQLPQSFHRSVANRKYLAATLKDFSAVPMAVEFRHASWQDPAVVEGLRAAGVTLVIPDAPDIASLYHHPPVLTGPTGYLRLHSRNADKWYAGPVERYDYHYSDAELAALAQQWAPLAESAEKIYAFFNNCHRGQAAENAQAFERIVADL